MQKQKQQIQEKSVSLELSSVKIEQLNKQPIIETQMEVSESGKWVMHRTIITDIKPISYYEKVLSNIKREE